MVDDDMLDRHDPDYVRPDTLPEALQLLARGGRMILAGGTDLYPATKRQSLNAPVLDISGLRGLRGISRDEDGIRIGACTTWSDIIAADLPPAFDALKSAAAEVGARQIQNVATLAGNICNASPAADGAPALLVLDAQVEMASPRGTRRLALTEFITGVRQTALARDEIVTGLFVPTASSSGTSSFLKLGARRYLVISIAMVAVRLDIAAGTVAAAAFSIGSCSARALRLPGLEAKLVGRPAKTGLSLCIEDIDVGAYLSPLDDIRASAAYRQRAAAELLRRCIERALP